MLHCSGTHPHLSPLFSAATVAAIFGAFNAGAIYLAGNSGTRELENSESRELGNSGAFANGGLVFDRERLDFGIAEPQEAFTCIVAMKNATDRDIHVSSFRWSCLCTSIHPPAITVPARGSANVTVTLNLLPTSAVEARGRDRLFQVHITPRVKGLPPLQGFDLRGTVRSPLGVYPPALAFGQLVRDSPTAPMTAIVRSSDPLAALEARCEHALVAVSVGRCLKEPACYEVSVFPARSKLTGRFGAEIRLHARTLSDQTLAPVTLPVTWEVVEDARVVPSALILDPTDDRPIADIIEIGTRSGAAIAKVEAHLNQRSRLSVEWLRGDRQTIRRARIRHSGAAPARAVEHIGLPFSVWRAGDTEPATIELSVLVRGKKPALDYFPSVGDRRGPFARTSAERE